MCIRDRGGNGHRVVYHPEPVGHQAVGKLIPGGAGFCQVFDSGPGDMAFVLIEEMCIRDSDEAAGGREGGHFGPRPP